MANFKVNDYVEICHSPDKRWRGWIDNAHDYFCGRVGIIEKISPDPDHENDRNEDLIRVTVYFGKDVFNLGFHRYYADFKKRHLIKTSYDAYIRQEYSYEAADETNHFETFTKNKRDEIFKYIFGFKKEEETTQEADPLEGWDEKTPKYDYDDYDPYI